MIEPSLTELRARFRDGADTPTAAVNRMLHRIEEQNSQLHTFLAVDADRALVEAERATELWRCSEQPPALLGLPISVKDNIEVAGMPTTYGSRLFVDNQQPDSEVARRLRAQGAIIIGKTNTPEFALVTEVHNRITPPGRNPLDTSRTCGGSSGGAAASVASGMSAAAIGTDSAGSIRIPAAYQGLVGFKPSYQRIPWVQEWKASLSRSHIGPITQTVEDAWLLTVTLAGPHWRDAASRLRALNLVDLERSAQRDTADQRVAILADHAADREQNSLLQDLEVAVHERYTQVARLDWHELVPPIDPPPSGWPYAGEHVAAALKLKPDFFDEQHALTDYARPIYEAGRRQTAVDYLQATQAQQRQGLDLARALSTYDYVFSLVAGEPPMIGTDYVPLPFPRLAVINLTGLPAVSVPFGSYPSGLPRAIQVTGRFGDDAGVLATAARLANHAL